MLLAQLPQKANMLLSTDMGISAARKKLSFYSLLLQITCTVLLAC